MDVAGAASAVPDANRVAVEARAPAIASVLARTVILLQFQLCRRELGRRRDFPAPFRAVYQNRMRQLIESAKFVMVHDDESRGYRSARPISARPPMGRRGSRWYARVSP
jgi:hypothetical protein